MIDISQKHLIKKFNPVCYSALSTAFYQAQEQEGAAVGPIEFLNQMLDSDNTDIHCLAACFEVPIQALKEGCMQALASRNMRHRQGQSSMFSSAFLQSVEDAWMYATLVYGQHQLRSGIWLLACLKDADLRAIIFSLCDALKQIPLETLEEQLLTLLDSSIENDMSAPQGGDVYVDHSASEKSNVLDQYTENLTQRAKNGDIDPIVGRDRETRQVVDILMRRRQNNPILVGEAGVGKTAVLEGLALKVLNKEVPDELLQVQVRSLDLSALQAGASVKGEFEKRLKSLIKAIETHPQPIILFIDEAHTLVGAGGAAGTGDAANILKPALARGQLRCIGATTWSEYKKYFEKDPALTRRFQVVKVEEPEEAQAITMLRSVVDVMQDYHDVNVLDEAAVAAVQLSKRYLPDRQLPDKAVSLLDTACARVASSKNNTPAAIESLDAQLEAIDRQLMHIEREIQMGFTPEEEAVSQLQEQRTSFKAERETLQEQWQKEQELVASIVALQAGDDRDDASEAPEQLTELLQQLRDTQGDQPFVHPHIDATVVASVVSDWTGIPIGKMLKDDVKAVLSLEQTLQEKVLGQDHAMHMIAKRLLTSKAGVGDPNKPVGVFMLVGPSGVGKTETAISLANTLFGGTQNLITINMSEFQEAHTVSTLKGAPPGYVGYGEGGVLTEAVRKKPYSVVLLDEIEKAHPDVHELFFQVFDKGVMEDGEGRQIDFRNTIILLTSNVGSEYLMSETEAGKDIQTLSDDPMMKAQLLEVFPAALLGRMVTIAYSALSVEILSRIIRLQLGRIEKRLADQHRIEFSYCDGVVDWILQRCNDARSGGRMIDNVLTNSLLPQLSERLLQAKLDECTVQSVAVSVVEDEQLAFDVHTS